LLVRPLDLGAAFVVHSLTKYLAGHGDVLGGIVVADAENLPALRALSRTCGPVLGPFECYLSMRGIKTFALRMERQCANACRVASWLATHPRAAKVNFPPIRTIPMQPLSRLFRRPCGAMLSFELKEAGREEVFSLWTV
jgi:cystathionine gamma-synthase/methionine-gamma-lyase